MDIPFELHLYNIRYFDDVIMTSRRETQMGDQVIFISYPLKFDLVKVTINRHQIRTGVPIATDYMLAWPFIGNFRAYAIFTSPKIWLLEMDV